MLGEHFPGDYGVQVGVQAQLGFNAEHSGRDEFKPVGHEGLCVLEQLDVVIVDLRQQLADLLLW